MPTYSVSVTCYRNIVKKKCCGLISHKVRFFCVWDAEFKRNLKIQNPTQMSHLHRCAPLDDKEGECIRELTDKCMANDLAKDPSKSDLLQGPV